MKIGYARVSTRGQNLDMQVIALEDAGCEKIRKVEVEGHIWTLIFIFDPYFL
jgi:DNA invertase Pin-like site-specific DNA recombinase